MNYKGEFTCKAVQTKFGDSVATNDITFIYDLSKDKLHRIMGDAMKVHMRSNANREVCWQNNGKPITVMVDDKGLTVLNPAEQERLLKELKRQEIINEMTSLETSPERVMELRNQLMEIK